MRPPPPSPVRLGLGLAALALAVLAVYARALGHDFVAFDDTLYVTENAWVRQGLSWAAVRWAFTTGAGFAWLPLTWLSYLASAELHGVERAGPWIAANVALHVAAAGLLFAALVRATGRIAAPLAVAALFALHPVQVESVAWVSARKEVLAGALFMGMLLAYAGYARRPSAGGYAGVLVLAALCLLAKGTLMALPFLLLLLDLWPLRRTEPPARLVAEKLPLLALVLADLALQLPVAGASQALVAEDPPLLARLPTAVMAVGAALGRLFWPVELSVVYPTPAQQGLGGFGVLPVAATFAVLAAATAVAVSLWRRAPWVTVGWLWFGLAIGPVSGIVPFGLRVMHDRYSYVPMIGIALLLVFSAERATAARPAARRIAAAVAALGVLACAVLAWHQVGVWKDSFTLFDHSLAASPRSAVLWYSRGIAHAREGRVERAIADLEQALAIRPDQADAHLSLGYLAFRGGDLETALPHLRRAVALRPDWPLARTNLGNALEARGEGEEALVHFRHAVVAGPETADAHYWLGLALERRGREPEARRHYERALVLEPSHPWAQAALERR